jgi:hypothetical protein
MLIGTRYVEKVAAGDMHSILFGMRAIWGIGDDDPPSFVLRVGGTRRAGTVEGRVRHAKQGA